MNKIEFKTFKQFGDYDVRGMTKPEPSCFNGMINVEKYKITIEKIKEPAEVVCARIQKLWDENDNMHNWACIQHKAKEYSYELKGMGGSKRKKK